MSDAAMHLDLNGLAGIVTGGGDGLGAAYVAALRAAGAQVAVLDVNAERVAELDRSTCEVAIVCDVSRPSDVARAFETALAELGRLDFLVNNAGVRLVHRFEDHPFDAWQRTLAVNLTGAFLCAQSAIPHMRRQGKGKIVNIASITAQLALSNRAAYNASKAGIVGLTRSIAYELGAEGIYCNAIAPGVIETPLTATYFADPERREAIIGATPLRRWGQPEDIASSVVFLCASASDFIQGTTLFVDGGWVAGKGY
jgi:NAD(P)-dependent dehydrogenase (short-subunit alcohol dehydrogenase family)